MSTSRETIFCEYPEDAADAAAALIHTAQSEAIRERGVFRIALSGGSTPALLYDTLFLEWHDDMQWEKWEVFWSDERAVPPDSKHSNYKLAYDRLLSKLPVGKIFPMPADTPDLDAAAADYSEEMKRAFGSDEIDFDVILLGMGADGHTASLFPHSPALEYTSFVAAVETDQEIARRLTFTLRTLNRARLVIFLVTGDSKAQTVKQVLVDEDHALPATRILPLDGRVVWIIDDAAASLME